MTEATAAAPLRLGVLISGGGTNLQALLDRCADGYIPGEVVVVISNRADAHGLERARKAGVATAVIDHRHYPDRDAFDAAMQRTLEHYGVELVCLAGFMRILTPAFVHHYRERLINIHPSLLPSFPGLHVQQQAIDAGVRFSGATVHFVEEAVDAGPIIVQAVVPLLPDDDADTLAMRILRQEHRIYPLAVRLFAQGRLHVQGKRVHVKGNEMDPLASLHNPTEGGLHDQITP